MMICTSRSIGKEFFSHVLLALDFSLHFPAPKFKKFITNANHVLQNILMIPTTEIFNLLSPIIASLLKISSVLRISGKPLFEIKLRLFVGAMKKVEESAEE